MTSMGDTRSVSESIESRTKSLRLLYLINGLGTGGAERSLAELLPRFEEAGIKTTIACLLQRSEGVEGHLVSNGHDVRFVGGRGMIARVRRLRKLIRSVDPDIVHTTHFESDVAGRLAALGSGVAVLTSLVNTPYDPVRRLDPSVSLPRLRLARMIDGWTARHLTTHFHAITHAVKSIASERMGIPLDRIDVVERGRDVQRLGSLDPERRRRVRSSLGLTEADRVIINVARREFQKGQQYLLSAFEKLCERGESAVLLIAGRDGSESRRLAEFRDRSAMKDRIRFLGHREDVPDLLAASDLFVFPSLYEGLGGSLIEAMALGLPIVASDIPAIREVVADAAELVPAAEPAALADAMASVLEDQLLAATLAARARTTFQRRFLIEASAQGMIDLYRSLVRPADSIVGAAR